MSLKDRFAEFLARRVDSRRFLDRLEVSVEKEVARMVRERITDRTKEWLDRQIYDYLKSEEFQTEYQGALQQALAKALRPANVAPVLIFEDDQQFARWRMHNLAPHGPFGTVNAYVEENGEEAAYNLALDRLKEQARAMDGNLVVLTQGEAGFGKGKADSHLLVGLLYSQKSQRV